jgi:hypothetical protein
MSYDLDIEPRSVVKCPDCHKEIRIDHLLGSVAGYFNYTSNLSPFFEDYIVPSCISEVVPNNPNIGKKTGLDLLNGLTGRQCEQVLSNVLAAINDDMYHKNGNEEYKFRKKYDSDNGWGSLEGAINWLGEIRDFSACNPDFLISVR